MTFLSLIHPSQILKKEDFLEKLQDSPHNEHQATLCGLASFLTHPPCNHVRDAHIEIVDCWVECEEEHQVLKIHKSKCHGTKEQELLSSGDIKVFYGCLNPSGSVRVVMVKESHLAGVHLFKYIAMFNIHNHL